MDAVSHIVSSERLGEPRTNRELFELLTRHGWLPAALLPQLRRMVGFRNLVVHGYEIVDPAMVRAIVERDLDDLLAFVEALRERLG